MPTPPCILLVLRAANVGIPLIINTGIAINPPSRQPKSLAIKNRSDNIATEKPTNSNYAHHDVSPLYSVKPLRYIYGDKRLLQRR